MADVVVTDSARVAVHTARLEIAQVVAGLPHAERMVALTQALGIAMAEMTWPATPGLHVLETAGKFIADAVRVRQSELATTARESCAGRA